VFIFSYHLALCNAKAQVRAWSNSCGVCVGYRGTVTAHISCSSSIYHADLINHLTPNGHYMGLTAQLTARCCILYIYSTNIPTEYFKHAAYSPFFFSLQNAVYFIMLPFLVPVLFTF